MLSELREQFLIIDQLIAESRPEITESLCRLLSFCTVSGSSDPEEKRFHANEMSRAFSYLHSLARQMGLTWRNYENRICVIEHAEGTEVIGIPLHIDVVPSGEGWHYPAFGGMVENDTIYGRGAQDDKGPVIETLYALHTLRRLKIPFRRTVRLILASQEETGDWNDVSLYLSKEPAPDMCIVPDADFPIVNGEKGMVDLQIRIEWQGELADRSSLRFRRFCGGERPNIVPNRAEIAWCVMDGQASGVAATLKHYLEEYLKANPESDAFPLRIDTDGDSGEKHLHVTFLGKSAHGSRPHDGHNAILDALRFFSGVPELPKPLVTVSDFLWQSCSDLYAAGLGISGEHHFLGKTTANLGILQMDPRGVTAIINIRPTLGRTSKDILEDVRARVMEWARNTGMTASVEFYGTPHDPLYVDPERHPELIGALQDAFTRVTGKEATLLAKGGTTFAKAFPNAVSYGPVYPSEEEGMAHQADECVRVEHLLRNTRIYAHALFPLALDYKAALRRNRNRGLGL